MILLRQQIAVNRKSDEPRSPCSQKMLKMKHLGDVQFTIVHPYPKIAKHLFEILLCAAPTIPPISGWAVPIFATLAG